MYVVHSFIVNEEQLPSCGVTSACWFNAPFQRVPILLIEQHQVHLAFKIIPISYTMVSDIYAVVTATILLQFDGHSTVYQRSLRSQ